MKKTKWKKNEFSFAVFYEEAPEGGYVATVPALPGCHTQGETLEEAEQSIKEAIEVYLESLLAHGEPIPEEPSEISKVEAAIRELEQDVKRVQEAISTLKRIQTQQTPRRLGGGRRAHPRLPAQRKSRVLQGKVEVRVS